MFGLLAILRLYFPARADKLMGLLVNQIAILHSLAEGKDMTMSPIRKTKLLHKGNLVCYVFREYEVEMENLP
ncbi:hypothetical protein CQA63_01160 [Helicobacter marmotae]|uniref:Uncharacterized protein n=1 Tax=Helicobacter marmotae TaxID=152490 RepID=A0A3D8I7L4_9HELI|nr:hypothetical protein CQA63_01160 [Helicobacter marmotae]